MNIHGGEGVGGSVGCKESPTRRFDDCVLERIKNLRSWHLIMVLFHAGNRL